MDKTNNANDGFDNFLVNATKPKEKTIYTNKLDEDIKEKLYKLANKGYDIIKPTLITKEVIKNAIENYKNEYQIYTDINMENCKEISLSFKNILKIDNLNNLIELETLRLDNNMIKKIENLTNLNKLKWLDLSFNNIKSISGLNTLVNLTDLSLFNNEITEISNFDSNNKLNILSIGNNKISDSKKMVDYLKKLNNLQGLTVSGNPFVKEFDNPGLSNANQTPSFPSSYEIILANLEHLKYLDYRPIDPEEVIKAKNSYKSDQKDRDQIKQDEEKDNPLTKFTHELSKADAVEIVEFWPNFIYQLETDQQIIVNVNFSKIPAIIDRINVLKDNVQTTLLDYKTKFINEYESKETTVIDYIKHIDANVESITQKCKDEIQTFKKKLKQKLNELPENWTIDSRWNKSEIDIDKLKDKLIEYEMFVKGIVSTYIDSISKEIENYNTLMSSHSSNLQAALEALKGPLRTALLNSIDNFMALNNDDNKDENLDNEYDTIIQDVEKLIEKYLEECEKLKEIIDRKRLDSNNQFLINLKEKESLRSRKRIEDINEVYEFWGNQIEEGIKKVLDKRKQVKEDKNNYNNYNYYK